MKRLIYIFFTLLVLTALVACNANVDEKLFTPKYAAKLEFLDGSKGPYYIKSQNTRSIDSYSLFTDLDCTKNSGMKFMRTVSYAGSNPTFAIYDGNSDIWTGECTIFQSYTANNMTNTIIVKGSQVLTGQSTYPNVKITVYEELVFSIAASQPT